MVLGMIARVKTSELCGVWEMVEPLLRLSLLRGGCAHLYSVGDVFVSLKREDRQLWLGFNTLGKVEGFAVTEIIDYPKARVLQIFALGGKDFYKIKDSGWELLESFALNTGCDYINFSGRLGWKKEMKDKGLNVTANYSYKLEN